MIGSNHNYMKSVLKYIYLLLFTLTISGVYGQKTESSFLFTDLRIYTGTGIIIENGSVGVTNGIIDFVGSATEANADTYREVISKNGLHLYPGLIAMNTTLGLTEIDAVRATRDFKETGDLNPNVRAISAYNAESEIGETVLDNGILFAQISPQGGTIKGSSSVVKLIGENWEDAAYRTDEGIIMDWPRTFKRKGDSDDPQGYTPDEDYVKKLNDIKTFFNRAAAYAKKEIPVERDLRMEAMRGIFDGSKRLYVSADFIKEIREIINFKRNYEIEKLSIMGGYDAWMAADLLKENDVSVLLGRVNSLPHLAEDAVDASYSLPTKLAEAGVKFCFTMAGSMETMNNRNLPFNIGTAIGYGLNEHTALTAATLHAAEILGIDGKTGSIEIGKEANFVLTAGDIFDMRTSIIKGLYLQGERIDLTTRQEQLYKKYKAKYAD